MVGRGFKGHKLMIDGLYIKNEISETGKQNEKILNSSFILMENHKQIQIDDEKQEEESNKQIEESYSINEKKLAGKSRKMEIVLARHVAMFLCREITSSSLISIGKFFT